VQIVDGSDVTLGTSAHPVRTDPTGTTPQPVTGTIAQGTPASLANAWSVEVTDGTHTMPAGDAPARAINVAVTDGTNVLGTAAHPQRTDPTGTTAQPITAAALPLPALAATSTLQTSGAQKAQPVDASGNVQPAGDVAARAAFVKMTDGTSTLGTPGAPVRTDPTGTTPQPTTRAPSTTGTVTSVAGAVTSTQLLAANSARKGAYVFNDSTALLYIKLGVGATTTSFSFELQPGFGWRLDDPYQGEIDGVWASATGNARVTELT
jgi:hypothetical protein